MGILPQVTDDGRFLILENWKGSEPQSQVFIRDLSDSTNSVKPLITGFDAEYIFVGSKENELYFLTDQKAPKRRLISLSAEDVDRSTWQEVIPEGENVLESVSLFGESFYCQRLANASSEVVVHDLSGRERRSRTARLGSVGGFGAQDAEETFFRLPIMSLLQQSRVDLATGATTLWRQPRRNLDRDALLRTDLQQAKMAQGSVMITVDERRVLMERIEPYSMGTVASIFQLRRPFHLQLLLGLIRVVFTLWQSQGRRRIRPPMA